MPRLPHRDLWKVQGKPMTHMMKADRLRFNRFVGGESQLFSGDNGSSMWFKNHGSKEKVSFAGMPLEDELFEASPSGQSAASWPTGSDTSKDLLSRRSCHSAKRWACNAKFTSSSEGPLASLAANPRKNHTIIAIRSEVLIIPHKRTQRTH